MLNVRTWLHWIGGFALLLVGIAALSIPACIALIAVGTVLALLAIFDRRTRGESQRVRRRQAKRPKPPKAASAAVPGSGMVASRRKLSKLAWMVPSPTYMAPT